MKLFHILTFSLVLFSLIISACGSTAPEFPPNAESPLPTEKIEENFPASTPTAIIATGQPPDIVRNEPIMVEIIARAMADLAKRLDISKNQVYLTDVKEVTWPDASLGCPQPGMAYAQVTTPGYWILLEASGNQYPYHTDMDTQAILCQEDFLPSFPITPNDIDDGIPWMPVD
jgi:hypothetical protein